MLIWLSTNSKFKCKRWPHILITNYSSAGINCSKDSLIWNWEYKRTWVSFLISSRTLMIPCFYSEASKFFTIFRFDDGKSIWFIIAASVKVICSESISWCSINKIKLSLCCQIICFIISTSFQTICYKIKLIGTRYYLWIKRKFCIPKFELFLYQIYVYVVL